MALSDNILRGQDSTLNITVKDASLTLVNLDTRPGIIFLILDKRKKILEQYSKVVQAGFKPMTIAVPSSGVFTVLLQSDKTNTAVQGIVTGELKLERVDAEFLNSTQHDVTTIDNLAVVKDAETVGETDLTP